MRLLVFLVFLLVAASASAGTYTITNTFTTGTTAVASQVNANFTGAKTAIDDNDARIDALLTTDTCTVAPCDLTAGTTLGGVSVLTSSALGVSVQAFDVDLSDLADGSLSGSKIGTGLDAAVITTGTIASTALLPAVVVEESEINSIAEVNALVADGDFVYNGYVGAVLINGAMVVTGSLVGGHNGQIITTTTSSLIATDVLGQSYNCTNAAGCDITLPSAAAGMNACWRDGNGGGVVTIDAAAGDEIELDGVGVGVADAIDSAGNRGDFICLITYDATTWVSLGRSGAWVDGGVD